LLKELISDIHFSFAENGDERACPQPPLLANVKAAYPGVIDTIKIPIK
jgi:hypothetical protein